MLPGELALTRHDLAWLDEARWRQALLTPLSADWLATLDEWFERRRPAVVRRQDSLVANALGLGVALPPARGKVKIALLVDRRAIIRTSPPLALAAAAESAPAASRTWLRDLAGEGRGLGIEFHVYGSLAWQHLSGEAYLTRSSDVDLLWRARDQAMLHHGLQLLAHWQRASGMRADGELLLQDGAAIAWKELLTSPRRVLVKKPQGVEMRATAEVLSRFTALRC